MAITIAQVEDVASQCSEITCAAFLELWWERWEPYVLLLWGDRPNDVDPSVVSRGFRGRWTDGCSLPPELLVRFDSMTVPMGRLRHIEDMLVAWMAWSLGTYLRNLGDARRQGQVRLALHYAIESPRAWIIQVALALEEFGRCFPDLKLAECDRLPRHGLDWVEAERRWAAQALAALEAREAVAMDPPPVIAYAKRYLGVFLRSNLRSRRRTS
jgi:hypothetical protein